MGQRTEKLKLQTDLQKLQSYRTHMESFKSHQENKVTALSEELEAASTSHYVEYEPVYQKDCKFCSVFFKKCLPVRVGDDDIFLIHLWFYFMLWSFQKIIHILIIICYSSY